jgi:uncharacterized membrane protein YozB (DUF420 family)
MNQTGCPSLWATDEVFLYDQETPGSCGASMVLWVVFAVVTLLSKFLFLGAVVVLWLKRRKSTSDAQKKPRKRWPVVPAIALIAFLAHGFFWILIGLNMISRGSAAALLGAMGSTSILPFMFYCLKFVRLGLSATPQLKKWKGGNTDESRLVKMDTPGKVLYSGALVSIVALSVCLIVLSPILIDDARPLLAGVGFIGTCNTCLALFFAMHIRRLQQA